MNERDWAVVIGVDGCADREVGERLQAPSRDAEDFATWLLDSGAVDASRLTTLLYTEAPPDPTRARVADALWRVAKQIEGAQARGEPGGRRLWLYLSGHGVEVARDSLKDTVLLAASAERGRLLEHVPGPSTADWFLLSGRFEEVVLVMDCCRHIAERISVAPLFDDAAQPSATPRRSFVALATRWSRAARERVIPPDTVVRGVFTAALLRGLRGAAADDEGLVTDQRLTQWLYQEMSEVAPNQEPDLRLDPNPRARMELARVIAEPPGTLVVRRASPIEVHIHDPSLESIASAPKGLEELRFSVPRRGQYLVVAGPDRRRIRMSGQVEVIDVG